MSLFPIVDGRARFDASGNVDSDRYSAGIRYTQEGAARSQTSAGTDFNQGIPMSSTGQVALVDATAGLPADVVWLSGLPISGNRVCISNKPVSVVSSGIPYDSAGAVAATVAPITSLPTLDLVFAGTATDPLDAATTADDTLSLNFVAQAYQIAAQYAVWSTGGLQAVNFADIVTFSRTGSTATYFNSAGVLTAAAADVPRFDYDPSTLALRGLLIEEARTNSIRNNTMQGGGSGVEPTNWTANGTTGNGITLTVVGVGIENGIAYVDYEINGTATITGTAVNIVFDTTTAIAASATQVWAWSSYLKLAAGTLTNLTFTPRISWRDSGGGAITSNDGTSVPTGAALSTQRFSFSATAPASTGYVQPQLRIGTVNGSTYTGVQIRIGLPQLEQGAFATSVIPTTTIGLTRNADTANIDTLAPWYNQVEGTVYAEFMNRVAGSATQTNGSQGVWSTTQSGLGSFNGYGLSTNLTASNPATIVFRSRYQPTSKNDFISIGATSSFLGANTVYKTAAAWDSLQITADSDVGALVTTTNNAAADMGTHNQMQLGAQNAGGAQPYQLNGWLRRISYYPRRLSSADLATITT